MIGYLGPKYSFTYFAATSFYMESELKPYDSILALFQGLHNQEVTGIVVPIENSIEGSVNLVVDQLFQSPFHIAKEIILKIELSLLAKTNNIDEIKSVMSHPHALAQCRNTLLKELGTYKEIQTTSTSKALDLLEDADDSVAVICSKQAPIKDYHVLLHDIGDEAYNQTRFVYISTSLDVQGLHNKCSIVCAAKTNQSGALYDILHEFALRGIGLSKIESRPQKEMLGEYVFYIDIDGNLEDEDIKQALDIIRYKTKYLKIVGSYYSKK